MEKTIRETVREEIDEHVREMLVKEHETNYCRLYVESDGSLWWSEEVDRSTYSPRGRDDIRETPSLCMVGTGSISCNCDWCSGPDAVESAEEIDFDEEACEAAQEEMERNLDEIEIGYFDDETNDD